MSVFAFTGDDDLQRQEALEAEAVRWESSGEGTAAREVYHGEELNAHAVAESYQTQDIFASRKLIIIRNFDKIRTEGYDKKRLDGKDLLLAAFRTANPDAAVLIEAEKLDARLSWVQALKKAGHLHDFKLPYGEKIPGWLVERAKKNHGRSLSLADARLLHEIVGNDTAELDHELEKLDTFLPKGAPVTAEAIHGVVSPLKVHTMFEFQKAAGLKNMAAFLPALRSLLVEQGGRESGIGPAIFLYNHFLRLARIRAMLDEDASKQDILSATKVNPYIFDKEDYVKQARSRELGRWKKVLSRLAALEREMKQGRYAQRFEIEVALAGVALG
jgi:DNA polymerase III delta subunit